MAAAQRRLGWLSPRCQTIRHTGRPRRDATAGRWGWFRDGPTGKTEQMADPRTDPFEKLVALLNYPMFVVTTQSDGTPAGCLVGFASQASIHPPRFLVGLSRRNHTFRTARDATHLAVHVFDHDHLDVAELFGSQTSDKVDKFDRCSWHPGPHRLPILDEAAAWFAGEILDRFSLGDHVGHLLAPVDGSPPRQLESWVSFGDVRHLEPGHEA
ncbi:flavin reductase [Mycobacterium avium subsp. hominissuis 10-4249]|nr:flavin reductase [Mycobacterium avium subsp. hominissuis 10-4249]